MKPFILVIYRLFLFAIALQSSPMAIAQQPIVTLRSTVTGNQEQPKVMYIVPWQQPGSSDFEYVLESTIADELFAPVDRDEFVRNLGYESKIESGGSASSYEE